VVLALGLSVLPSCGPDEPAAAPPASSVVDDALRALEREVAAEDARLATAFEPLPADEARERTEGLVTFLSGATGALRESALEEARLLGDPALDGFLRIADDAARPHQERRAALRLVGALETPSAHAALLQRLGDLDVASLRFACARGLRAPGAAWCVPGLVFRLKYELDESVVVGIALALADHDNLSGLDGLENVAVSGATPEVRALAGSVLADLASRAGVADHAALRAAWESAVPPPPGGRELTPREELEVQRWIGRLSEFQLRGVDDARFVLSRMRPEAARALGAALDDESPYIRLHAAQCLERMGRRGIEGAQALESALLRPDLAPQAALALGTCGGPAARAPLEARLDASHAPGLRIAAARGLGRLGESASAAALRGVLEGENPVELQQAAGEALLALGEEPGDALLRALAGWLTDPRVEPSTTEAALGTWLRGEDPHRDGARAEWDAANGLSQAERLAARAAAVQSLLP
jgi:HEAT repeat protein